MINDPTGNSRKAATAASAAVEVDSYQTARNSSLSIAKEGKMMLQKKKPGKMSHDCHQIHLLPLTLMESSWFR